MSQPSKVIPFYGAVDRRLFEIERRCMDRRGVVLRRLDGLLPCGEVLVIGAGNGFTAERLTRRGRRIVPLEPAAGMIDGAKSLPWVRGVAQEMPFRTGAFAAAYATWAYFFPEIGHGEAGLREAHRVVAPGGPIVMVDNAGDDAFSALGEAAASDPLWWEAHGFAREVVSTSFAFDSLAEARELLGFYFGDAGRERAQLEIEYKVAVYTGRSRGG